MISANYHHNINWATGGIGIHACLRNMFRKDCEFESHVAHHQVVLQCVLHCAQLVAKGVSVVKYWRTLSSLRNYRQLQHTITGAINSLSYLCFFKILTFAQVQVVLQHTQQDCCISTQVQSIYRRCSHYVRYTRAIK